MAVQVRTPLPAFTTGTISGNSGSTVVTGVLTGWTTVDASGNTINAVQPGDMLITSTIAIPINTVVSATQLILECPLPSSINTGSTYRIIKYSANMSGGVTSALTTLLAQGSDSQPYQSLTVDNGAGRLKSRVGAAGDLQIAVGPTGAADVALVTAIDVSQAGLVTFPKGSGRTQVNDTAYAILSTDRVVAVTALTAARAMSLPTAASYPLGTALRIVDESGNCSANNAITLTANGTDLINGSATAVLNAAYAHLALESNGSGKWTLSDSVSSVAGRTGSIALGVSDVSGAAPIASPTFTGTPTSPTPSAKDGSTKLATTAYVDRATTGLMGKNLLINGNFAINQRGYTSGANVGSGGFFHDRWKQFNSSGNYTFTQANSAQYTSGGTVDTVITIPSGSSVSQLVEAQNVVGGVYTTSWAGTSLCNIYYYNGSTNVVLVANAASPVTFTAPAGVTLALQFGSGTLSTVQTELGVVATPFERRGVGLELLLCQRYFQRLGGSPNARLGIAIAQSTTFGYVTVPLLSTMRAAPSLAYGGNICLYNGNTIAVSSLTLDQSTPTTVDLAVNVSSGLTASNAYAVTGNSDSTAHIDLIAEF